MESGWEPEAVLALPICPRTSSPGPDVQGSFPPGTPVAVRSYGRQGAPVTEQERVDPTRGFQEGFPAALDCWLHAEVIKPLYGVLVRRGLCPSL